MYKGVLLISNPRISEKTPHGRIDESFIDVAIGKLKYAIDLARERELRPLIFGDLTGQAQERNLLIPIGRALRDAKAVLVKTPQAANLNFCERVLEATGVIEVVENKQSKVLQLGGKSLLLGAKLTSLNGLSECNAVDYALISGTDGNEGADLLIKYPALANKCFIVKQGAVSGSVVSEGKMLRLLIPSLLRINADEKDSVPGVIAWTLGQQPVPEIIPSVKNVFELSAKTIWAEKKAAFAESQFTALLAASEKAMTGAGSSPKEQVAEILAASEEMEMSDQCRMVIKNLAVTSE